MKMKKIILLITLLFLLIGIANATSLSNDTTNHDNTEKITHKTPNTIKTVEKSSEQIVEKKTIQKENRTKNLKTATITVNDYNSLHNALTSDTYDTLTVNMESDIILKDDTKLKSKIKNLTINGNGKTIDGNNKYQFLNISSADTVRINNINIINCNATWGGAKYNQGDTTLIISNSTFKNNHADNDGGAIYFEADIYEIKVTFWWGGSRWVIVGRYGTFESYNNKYINNSANDDGGAIYNCYTDDFKIRNDLFDKNNARQAGAIDNTGSGTITIDNTTFTNNNASYNGVIYNGGLINITKSKFINNHALEDGGVMRVDGTVNINNSVFINNFCNDTGATLWIMGGTANLSYNTFQYNKAGNYSQKKCIDIDWGDGTSIIEDNINDNISTDYSTIYAYSDYDIRIVYNNFTNTPIKTKTSVDPVKGVIGEEIELKATLTDEYGCEISGGNLAFKLNGKTLRTDGRFDSNAPAMKFSVKNGLVTYTIKADLYLRNAKNLTASYSGTSKYIQSTSPSVTAQIQKRNAQVTVTTTPSKAKQYETLTFKVTAKDVTKNGKNSTLISDNTKVMLKVNGVTLKDSTGKTLYITLDKNDQATYKYTIPAGTGGITARKAVRNYTVTAIFVGNNYYPGAKNTTKFQVERSPTTVTITQARVTKTNVLSLKATLKDYKGNNLIGTNKVTIKINGKNYVDPKNGKAKYWSVKNGDVNLNYIQIDPKTTIKRVMIVTGERQAYTEGRNEISTITRV